MSERKDLEFGDRKLVWNDDQSEYVAHLGQSGFGYIANVYRENDQVAAWQWEIECPGNSPIHDIVKSTSEFDTAKQAAVDLVSFLGGIRKVTEGFS